MLQNEGKEKLSSRSKFIEQIIDIRGQNNTPESLNGKNVENDTHVLVEYGTNKLSTIIQDNDSKQNESIQHFFEARKVEDSDLQQSISVDLLQENLSEVKQSTLRIDKSLKEKVE